MKTASAKLVFELSKLPGVGERTATRLAYYILKQDAGYAEALAQAILTAKQQTHLCDNCYNLTDQNPCVLCEDRERNPLQICVVEKPSDVHSIESTRTFRGNYHVLHGLISPLDGIGPQDLKIDGLLKKAHALTSVELIFAINPSIEGDATALYLSRLLKPLGNIRTFRLAYGIPMGGQIEFSDKQTLSRALENRVEITS
jgi:recombination protein RecR